MDAPRLKVKVSENSIPMNWIIMDSPGLDDSELWTVEDVAAYLRTPVSWVYENHVQYFRAVKIGGHLRFSPVDIKGWVATKIRLSDNR